jgi:hypothetical protein
MKTVFALPELPQATHPDVQKLLPLKQMFSRPSSSAPDVQQAFLSSKDPDPYSFDTDPDADPAV